MATTTFSAGTVVESSWLNDVDDITYRKAATLVLDSDHGTGTTALATAITAIGSTETILFVTEDAIISANLTIPQNITLRVNRGAVITISSGITLTVEGRIEAGNYVIFAGTGTLDLNAGSAYFNITWFDGTYLNDKWDFILRGLVSLRPYTVYVPKPELGMQGAVEVSTDLVYWGIDAPLLFPDKTNGGQWISGPDVRIIATAVMDAMMEFSTDSKVEDITFPTGLWLIGDAKATYGMEFHGGSRIRSNGLIQITDCATCIYFDNTIGSNDKINLHSLYFARWTTSAIFIEGSGDSMVACNFPEIVMEVPGANLTNCIVVRGSTRNVDFGRVYYDTAGSGFSATNIILVQSTASGYSIGLLVDDLYAVSAATNLVKIENSGGSQRAISTTLGKLTGTTGTVAANLNYDIYTSILEKPVLAITYGGDCQEPKPNTNIITRTYDFAVSGGAIATYNLGGSLPNGSTIIRAWYLVETVFTSGGAATVRLGITGTLDGIQAILAYNNAAYTAGLHDGVPNGTAATALTQVTNSTTFPSLVIAGAALTAGKVTVYMEILS